MVTVPTTVTFNLSFFGGLVITLLVFLAGIFVIRKALRFLKTISSWQCQNLKCKNKSYCALELNIIFEGENLWIYLCEDCAKNFLKGRK